MTAILPDHIAESIRAEIAMQAGVACEAATDPHVLMRPRVYPDGDQWCALYGENLQMGVCAFGDSPEAACAAFDRAWRGAA